MTTNGGTQQRRPGDRDLPVLPNEGRTRRCRRSRTTHRRRHRSGHDLMGFNAETVKSLVVRDYACCPRRTARRPRSKGGRALACPGAIATHPWRRVPSLAVAVSVPLCRCEFSLKRRLCGRRRRFAVNCGLRCPARHGAGRQRRSSSSPDVGVVLVKVDQTGQPRTPSGKFESTIYGKCLLFKENSASPIASRPRSSVGQESTLQRKLTPVILHIPEEVDTWLTAPTAEALKLQRPLPDGTLQIVAHGTKEDGGVRAAAPAGRIL
jgi:hypothetical protein